MTKAKPKSGIRTLRARASKASQVDVAEILGVNAEAVRRWTLEGCPRLPDGTYVIAEVVSWRIKRAVETERAKRKDDEKPKTELNRKLAVEADLKELQLKREQRESLPAEEYQASVQRIVAGFAAVAKGRLARFEREAVKVAADKNPPAAARRLMDRISVALLEGAHDVARELDEEAAADEAAGDEEAA